MPFRVRAFLTVARITPRTLLAIWIFDVITNSSIISVTCVIQHSFRIHAGSEADVVEGEADSPLGYNEGGMRAIRVRIARKPRPSGAPCLCRGLCRNPPIPAGVGLCRMASLGSSGGAGNIDQSRMNTAPAYQ
jgi:hypothetical protein